MNDKQRPRSAQSLRAERAFRERVTELGGTVLETEWLGSTTRRRVRCLVGHEHMVLPASVQQGRGICSTCAGKDSKAAERAFHDNVTKLGGTVLEPTWLGVSSPHRVRCALGHENSPRPAGLHRGGGLCLTCAGMDTRAAERAFRERVAELGGVVLEPKWLGTKSPHRIRCAAGHESSPHPGNVRDRGVICRTCADRDPAAAEQAFRDRVTELGGTVLEVEWRGVHTPHRILCAAGHERSTQPSHVSSGRGLCLTCARKDPVLAEQEFRARVAELGGTILEPEYLGANVPHRIRCAEGHEGSPRPTHVQSGEGICRRCAGKAWDAFYVVANTEAGLIKFGITSGDPRPRLARHAKDGFKHVLRTLTGLPGSVAPDLERSVMATLRLAGDAPVRGREYYNDRVTAVVLDTVDNFPIQPLDLDPARRTASVAIPAQQDPRST